MNQETITINEMLHGKMRREYLTFLEELEQKESTEAKRTEEIIACSYEKVFKEDILMCIEENNLPYEKAKALLREPYPLDICYHAWLRNDSTYMKNLQECIEDQAKEIERRNKMRKERSEFFKYLEREGYSRDMTGSLDLPKKEVVIEEKSIVTWSEEEINRIFDSFSDVHTSFRLRFFIILAYYTGARINELLALKYDDFSSEGVRINKQVIYIPTFERYKKSTIH